MSALSLDIEVHADREEGVRALFAALADEGSDDELPPIIPKNLWGV